MTARIPLTDDMPANANIHVLGPAYQPHVHEARERFQAAVVRLPWVDAVTTELVRLRCARVHQCKT